MNTTFVRRLAAGSAAVLLSAVGVLATYDAAHGVTAARVSSGLQVQLSPAETVRAAQDGYDAALDYCSSAIDQALRQGIFVSDVVRHDCGAAVVACADQTLSAGAVVALTTLYDNGTVSCLPLNAGGPGAGLG